MNGCGEKTGQKIILLLETKKSREERNWTNRQEDTERGDKVYIKQNRKKHLYSDSTYAKVYI